MRSKEIEVFKYLLADDWLCLSPWDDSDDAFNDMTLFIMLKKYAPSVSIFFGVVGSAMSSVMSAMLDSSCGDGSVMFAVSWPVNRANSFGSS